MRVLFATFHPVDPQVVRYVAKNLIYNGDKILFTVVEKENIINDIIKSYGFPSKIIGKNKKSLLGKLINLLCINYNMMQVVRKFEPDIIFSPTSPYNGIISKLFNISQICWADTETAGLNLKSSLPFIDTLLIPESFYKNLPQKNKIKYNGYKEIAYLHPNWFKPDKNILNDLNLKPNGKIVLMRFSALNAMHDRGLKSELLTNEEKVLNFIKKIEKLYGAKVFISMTERNLDSRFDKYKLNIHPSNYIQLLSFCSLYLGEGTTTASEAGVLGIPWINIQKTKRGYLIDQEENYGLGFRMDNLDKAFLKAEEFLKNNNINKEWKLKREKLLEDKIDVTSFFTWFLINYPNSRKVMIENPNFQNNFK